MKDFAHIASRLFNAPLLVTPEAAQNVANYLGSRIDGEAQARAGERMKDFAHMLVTPEAAQNVAGYLGSRIDGEAQARAGRKLSDLSDEPAEPYTVDVDGVATIAVHGELINRGSWMHALSGVTSYKTIVSALDAAVADPRVRGIVLDLDSPGGEAAGAMETAAHVRAISQSKTVVAYIDSLAASAAYALASGASEIIATPSATLGSIGVVWLHLDRSQAMASNGVTPTLLHAGAHKIDGHSMGPLPDDARARIQGQIDQVYALFLDTIDAHRPKLGRDGAKKTEAGVFLGQRAVEAGLADRVGTRASLKSAFPRKSQWSLKMPENDPIHTQAALEAAVAAARREASLQTESAVALAVAGERARIAAIIDAPIARGREAQARHFAFKTAMAPVDALAALEVAPIAAEAPVSALAAAMDRFQQPGVGAGAPGAGAQPPRTINTEDVYARRAVRR